MMDTVEKSKLIETLTGFRYGEALYKGLTGVAYIDDAMVCEIARDKFFKDITFDGCGNVIAPVSNKEFDIEAFNAAHVVDFIKSEILAAGSALAHNITVGEECTIIGHDDMVIPRKDTRQAFIKNITYVDDSSNMLMQHDIKDGYMMYYTNNKGNENVLVIKGGSISVSLLAGSKPMHVMEMHCKVGIKSATLLTLGRANDREDILRSFGDSEEIILKCVPRGDNGMVNGRRYEKSYKWKVDKMYDNIIMAIQNHFHNN